MLHVSWLYKLPKFWIERGSKVPKETLQLPRSRRRVQHCVASIKPCRCTGAQGFVRIRFCPAYGRLLAPFVLQMDQTKYILPLWQRWNCDSLGPCCKHCWIPWSLPTYMLVSCMIFLLLANDHLRVLFLSIHMFQAVLVIRPRIFRESRHGCIPPHQIPSVSLVSMVPRICPARAIRSEFPLLLLFLEAPSPWCANEVWWERVVVP
mmetsp:Transcript_10649/g.65643  ORF Transcript_10649/g.65643 Transcript_10649/m.65643 type:complete len:206 (+) Transcript_10649:2062-2679(+)